MKNRNKITLINYTPIKKIILNNSTYQKSINNNNIKKKIH